MNYFEHMKRPASQQTGKRADQSHNDAISPTLLTLLVALASWIVAWLKRARSVKPKTTYLKP